VLLRLWQVEETGSLLAPWEKSIPALERAALRIGLASSWVVPGLFQCAAYAELMMAEGIYQGSRQQIRDEARRRAARYDALRRDADPWITAVFPRRAVANLPGPVRSDQVKRIRSITDGGRARVHLLPDDGVGPGLVSPLMLFHLRDGGIVAASEHNRGVVLHDNPTDHERLATQFQRALGGAMSAETSVSELERMLR
jgi:hypothetical protein